MHVAVRSRADLPKPMAQGPREGSSVRQALGLSNLSRCCTTPFGDIQRPAVQGEDRRKKKNETMGNVVGQSRGGGQRKVTVKYGKNKNEV